MSPPDSFLLAFTERYKNLSATVRQHLAQDHFWRGFVLCLICVMVFFLVGVRAPAGYSDHEKIVSVKEGLGLRETGILLENELVVRSHLVFQFFVILLGGEKSVKHGDYLFDHRQNAIEVAWRLTHGKFDVEPRKVFIPEGATVQEIAELAGQQLHNFEAKEFLGLAKSEEGFLFPDTYYFLPGDGVKEVYQKMRLTFEQKINPYRQRIRDSGHTLKEIMTMASIIEEETKETEARKIVSGILWKRIGKDIPLQVDATFVYINGKNTFELSLNDLKVDSPYNTYKYKGLPPGPISNPGLRAVEAALEPLKTPYLFYLSDLNGNMHYGKDFAEHKANKAKYLP